MEQCTTTVYILYPTYHPVLAGIGSRCLDPDKDKSLWTIDGCFGQSLCSPNLVSRQTHCTLPVQHQVASIVSD